MADQVAQAFINNTTNVPKNTDTIDIDHNVNNLTGDLIVKDFPDLEHIILRSHGLTSLTIVNCPKLNDINVSDNNNIKKVDVEKTVTSGDGKNIIKKVQISGNGSGFDELNLKKCSVLGELEINDLGEIKIV